MSNTAQFLRSLMFSGLAKVAGSVMVLFVLPLLASSLGSALYSEFLQTMSFVTIGGLVVTSLHPPMVKKLSDVQLRRDGLLERAHSASFSSYLTICVVLG